MINAFCFYFGEDSWSRHARAFFGAWREHDQVIVTSWNEPRPEEPLLGVSGTPSDRAPGIGLGPIELMPTVRGSRRIAYVVWETTIMPQDKLEILRSMDEIWVPSTWGRQLLIDNGIPPSRVAVVPEGVDVETFKPVAPERGGNRPFRFLFVGKWEERKAVDLLIKAYIQEFDPEEPVELVLHAWNPYIRGFDLEAKIRSAIRGRRTASIIASAPLAEDALVGLYNSCDAFVLPTRAEGWGLPITEAMACGLPVIVTNYSAPVDYLDDDIAYLIPVAKLVSVRDRNFFPSGRALGKWAQPDAKSLRRIMRHVFENPEEAREKGRLARQAVCDRWTWAEAVKTARRRLADSA